MGGWTIGFRRYKPASLLPSFAVSPSVNDKHNASHNCMIVHMVYINIVIIENNYRGSGIDMKA